MASPTILIALNALFTRWRLIALTAIAELLVMGWRRAGSFSVARTAPAKEASWAYTTASAKPAKYGTGKRAETQAPPRSKTAGAARAGIQNGAQKGNDAAPAGMVGIDSAASMGYLPPRHRGSAKHGIAIYAGRGVRPGGLHRPLAQHQGHRPLHSARIAPAVHRGFGQGRL